MDALLLKLRIFTETHFTYEETVLELTGYPRLEPHRALHQSMRVRTRQVMADLAGSRDCLSLLHLLRDWWLDHIQGIDRQYVPHVERLGL
jgi:hemerythrin-like metal-binding protein